MHWLNNVSYGKHRDIVADKNPSTKKYSHFSANTVQSLYSKPHYNMNSDITHNVAALKFFYHRIFQRNGHFL